VFSLSFSSEMMTDPVSTIHDIAITLFISEEHAKQKKRIYTSTEVHIFKVTFF